MRALGIAGANVTMPHKRAVLDHLDEVSGEAQRIGAANVIVRAGDRLIGANTDGAGFLRFLQRTAGAEAAGANVVLLGAGGAARAVGVALADAGARVTIVARAPETAGGAAAAIGEGTAVVPWTERAQAASAADVIVNATPVGTSGEESPLPADAMEPRHLVVDLVYAPPVTPLLAAARAAGARGHNGLGMLVEQAALAFELWTGRPAPSEAMSAAALAAIAGGTPAPS
jgi:shikimate dehydrogenase